MIFANVLIPLPRTTSTLRRPFTTFTVPFVHATVFKPLRALHSPVPSICQAFRAFALALNTLSFDSANAICQGSTKLAALFVNSWSKDLKELTGLKGTQRAASWALLGCVMKAVRNRRLFTISNCFRACVSFNSKDNIYSSDYVLILPFRHTFLAHSRAVAIMYAIALFALIISLAHASRPPDLPIVHPRGSLQGRGVPGNSTGLIQYLSNGDSE